MSGQKSLSAVPGSQEWLAVLVLAFFLAGVVRLAHDSTGTRASPRIAVNRGLLLAALLVIGAFVVNRNIFNSDNYRYLVYLLPCWALGFGLLSHDLARRGLRGRLAAWVVTGILIELMTVSAFHWYRDTRHYLDASGKPVTLQITSWSELIVRGRILPAAGPDAGSGAFHVPSDVSHVFGGYWDVYRMAFLSNGQLIGIPYPMFPNRFPGWSRGLGRNLGKLLVLQPREESQRGGKSAADSLGGRPAILLSANRIDWRPAFETVWKGDGRAPADVNRLRVVVP